MLANGGKAGMTVDKEPRMIDGKAVYEAGIKGKDGNISDLVITEDGKLVKIKTDDAADQAAERSARAERLLQGLTFSHPREITHPADALEPADRHAPRHHPGLGPQRPWKQAAFSQYPRPAGKAGQSLMGYSMRTDRYRFTVWVSRIDRSKVDAIELYDHHADPQENTNVAPDPANAALVETLTAQWRAGWRGALAAGAH